MGLTPWHLRSQTTYPHPNFCESFQTVAVKCPVIKPRACDSILHFGPITPVQGFPTFPYLRCKHIHTAHLFGWPAYLRAQKWLLKPNLSVILPLLTDNSEPLSPRVLVHLSVLDPDRIQSSGSLQLYLRSQAAIRVKHSLSRPHDATNSDFIRLQDFQTPAKQKFESLEHFRPKFSSEMKLVNYLTY